MRGAIGRASVRPAEGAGDGAGARAELEDRGRSRGTKDQRPFDECLGLRSGDEHARTKLQHKPAELRLPQKVLDGLVPRPARHQRLEGRARGAGHRRLTHRVEAEPRRPEHPGQEGLGVLTGRRDPRPGEALAGGQ